MRHSLIPRRRITPEQTPLTCFLFPKMKKLFRSMERLLRARNSILNPVRMKDLTADLPDDVLCEVIKHLPSLSEAFKVAGINHKFRRCALMLLRTPMWLSLDFKKQQLIRCKVPIKNWPSALKILCERTRFWAISIYGDWLPSDLESTTLLEEILKTIIDSHSRVLEPATSYFQTVSVCDSSVLKQLLSKCPKLIELNIWRFVASPTITLDLGAALDNKALTEVTLLNIPPCTTEQVIHLFGRVKPNSLKSVELRIDSPLNITQLVNELSAGAWAALKKLDVTCYEPNDVDFTAFFVALVGLPSLTYCKIWYQRQPDSVRIPFGQFAASIESLFQNNARANGNKLVVEYRDARINWIKGCAIVGLVAHLKHQHPSLEFEIGRRDTFLKFTFGGNSFIADATYIGLCDDQLCFMCPRFYSVVLYAIFKRAQTLTSGHIDDRQMDRCRICRVVEHVNDIRNRTCPWKALTIVALVANDPQDLATIIFETEDGNRFYVSVACGHCFNRSCSVCYNMD